MTDGNSYTKIVPFDGSLARRLRRARRRRDEQREGGARRAGAIRPRAQTSKSR